MTAGRRGKPSGQQAPDLIVASLSPSIRAHNRYGFTLCVILSVSTLLIGFTVSVICTACRPLIRAEDNLVESLTAVLFLGGALVALKAWVSRRGSGRGIWTAGVAALCLLAALEELSFGTRLIGFGPPTFSDVEIDATHDVVSLGAGLLQRGYTQAPALFSTLFVVFAGIATVFSAKVVPRIWRHLRRSESLAIFAYFCVLNLVALVLDVIDDRFSVSRLAIPEELIELAGAFTILVLSLRLWIDGRKTSQKTPGADVNSRH